MPYYICFHEDGTMETGYEKKPAVYRSHKGNSLIRFQDDYVVIDLETTGFDTDFDEIIELSALKVQNGAVVDKYNTLVKPSQPIDDYIVELTGITNDMVANAPSIDNVLDDFVDFIGNFVIVGHNVSFDMNFLYDNLLYRFNKYLSNDYIDTMRLSRILFPEWKHHRLRDMISEFGIEVDRLHRALSDCLATYSGFEYMKAVAISRFSSLEAFAEDYAPANKKSKSHRKGFDVNHITPTVDSPDESNPLFGKVCVFTGTLERMARKDALQCVVNLGGICSDSVTAKTNFLILGNNDYCTTIKDGKSNKQKKAEQLRLKGNDIEIITENVFYDILDEYSSNQEPEAEL